MRLRRLQFDDQAIVDSLHAASGYDFQFPNLKSPLIEAGCLIEDTSGEAIAISVAQRAPMIELAMRKEGHALVKLRALSMIHDFMGMELPKRGYHLANCFLPPEIDKSYGRHLRRKFGWQKRWPGYVLGE